MQIDTRLVGRVEMQVRYENYAPLPPAAEPKTGLLISAKIVNPPADER